MRFGAFELDLKAGELYRGRARVRLPEQPLRVLLMLVERPGEILTREEIKKKLWPNNTIVEFDQSIHSAIRKVRQALGDSADKPKYVETVGRRGYRLLVAVECLDSSSGADAVRIHPEPTGLVGKQVSHYRVLDVIGGGGMGMVYRAEDLKLGRNVALKFLPEEVADNPVALRRFEREARTASSLNHPNICSIYEFGEHEGQPFIAMELLEGETLRDRLTASAESGQRVSLDELLRIGTQVCEGLEAAHDRGIIHRDIKPANIFLTAKGTVKILDFGLAKVAENATGGALKGHGFGRAVPPSAQDERGGQSRLRLIPALPSNDDPVDTPEGVPFQSNNPNGDAEAAPPPSATLIEDTLTRTGAAMGTAGYMSPEQVRGEKLDARTDLFSFGLVLYEMVTGKRAFSGQTAAILRDAILHDTPLPTRELNSSIPAPLEQIIDRATKKDRERRYQSASEMRSDLLVATSCSRSSTPERSPLRLSWKLVSAVAALILVVLVLVGVPFLARRRPSSPPPQIKQTQLTTNSAENEVENGVISPDGKYLAYSDLRGQHFKLLETGETKNLSDPPELKGLQVAWGVFPLSAERFLAESSIPGRPDTVWTVLPMDGIPHKLREDAALPLTSPDGSIIAFLRNNGRQGYREIWLMDGNGEHVRKFYEADENTGLEVGGWSPDGQRVLLYSSHRSGDHIDISLESLDLDSGPATTVITDANLQAYVWLRDGRIIYALRESDSSGLTCNLWAVSVDASGTPRGGATQFTDWPGFCVGGVTVTADGKKLVTNKWRTQGITYVAEVAGMFSRPNPRRLTLSDARERPMGWTSDSKGIVFISDRDGKWGIFKQSPGQESAETILTGLEDRPEAAISPDGKWILYQYFPNGAAGRLLRVPISGGAPQLVLTVARPEGASWWSERERIAPRCSKLPAQVCAIAERSANGRELIFTAFDPMKGRGKELARLEVEPTSSYKMDISSDGTRIAVLKRSENRIQILSLTGQPGSEIVVVGWKSLESVDWAADGKGLFVSGPSKGNSVLLYTDLHGKATVLWEQAGEQPGQLDVYARPSPDGRRLALFGWSMSSNMWMLENF